MGKDPDIAEVSDFWSVQAEGLLRDEPSSFKNDLTVVAVLECDKSISAERAGGRQCA